MNWQIFTWNQVLRVDKNWKRLGALKPEEKVLLCMDMTDGCLQICADGIRNQFPEISEEQLVNELRKRLEWSKRSHRIEK